MHLKLVNNHNQKGEDKYELSLYIYEIYDEKFNALVAETVFAC